MARPSHKTGAKRGPSRVRDKRAGGRAPAHDLAESAHTLRALRESEERFRATFEQAAFGVAHTTTEGAFLQVNSRLCQILGYTAGELLAMTTRDLTHPEDRDKQNALRKELLAGRRLSFAAEKRYVRKDGSDIWVNRTVTLARRSSTGARYLIQVIEDISERKRTEARLDRLTRARRVMAECNHVLIHASDESRMLESMCRIVVESGGYKMAWVGYPTGDDRRAIHAVAHAGFEGDAPMSAPVAWSTDGRYQGFMWEVIATGKPHVARDILNDRRYERRRNRALQHGFQSSIALPLKDQTGILGAIAIYASEADAFDDEEIALLTELADDIAYGIVNLRIRTAREQAEERSRETERRFRETFEQAAVGLTRVDLSGHLVDFNQKFCDMLGYTREELIGKAIRDITHPEDYGQGSNYRAQLVEGAAKSRAGEKRFIRKDGTVLWARRTMSTACDAAGRPQYVISVVEDITERKETDERYRATFDGAPVGIMHTSIGDDAVVHANPRLCEMLGYSQDELLGMVTDDLIPAELRGTDRGNYRERMLSGELKTFSSERKFLHKDGSSIWVNRTVSLARDSTGKPLYFIRIIEDITERKKAEQQFHDTFDQAAVGIAHVGFDEGYIRVNRKFREITGFSEAELIGSRSAVVSHPDDVGSGDPARKQLLAGEIDSYANEKRYLRKDGATIWVNRTESLARDETGKPLHFIRVIEDITGRKKAEQQFQDTFEQAAVGIFHADLNGRYLRVNQKFCEITGYTEEELTGPSRPSLSYPGDVDSGSADRKRLLSGKITSHSNEKRYVRKDGGVIWVNRTESLARDEAGNPLYMIRVVQDITERVLSTHRRAMEHAVTQALAESTTVEGAMRLVLQTICQALEWTCGAYWKWDERDELLRCAETWHMNASGIPEFLAASIEHPNEAPAWQGKAPGTSVGGIVRRVWFSGAPVWFPDVLRQPDFRRGTTAARADLRSAFGFPILSGARPLGVMEFYSREIRQPDEALLQVVQAIGSQIGQFIQRQEVEQALRRSEERYRDVFDASPLPMWVWDDETLNILAVNQAAVEHYGYSRDEFLGMNVRDIWSPDEAPRYEQNIRNRQQLHALHLERRHRTKDGRIIDTEVTARLFALGGRAVWLTLANDISVRLRAEAALRESEEQFRQLSGNIPQVFWITDTTNRQTLYVSPAAETMLGRPLQDILSDRRALVRAVHKEDRARVYAARRSAVESGYDETYRILRSDGSIRWVHDRAFPVRDGEGRIYRIAGIAEDVTDRKHTEERLEHLAHYDVLTNLPNRALFYDRLKQALVQAKRNRWTMGIMFIDADRFKHVNDTLGHAVGDKLLQQIAGRLTRSVRSGDTVGRLGGDEFAIVLSTLASAQDVNLVAQKIIAAFNEPFKLEGTEVYVTVSIGITLYPDDSSDQDILVKNADVAMYRAKESGRNGYQFYTPEMNARVVEQLGMESSLRRSLERNEFLLYYQPKASVADGDITGVEALLRWRHPDRGLISPAEFIPLLEESGLIVQVGEWVLKAVCSQIKAWERDGDRPVPVAVNLSARQFTAKDLGPTIKRILEEHQVDPALIEFEITESSLMANTEEAVLTLEYLDQLGVGLSIDDFGTGYSSLGYLKRFPLSALKIDRSFVRDVTTDGDDATITRAVISMAHSLGLKVIAEGVETAAQLEFLAEYGCNEMQGYYFAHPLTAEDCSSWIRGQRRLERPRRDSAVSAPVVLLLDDDDDTLAHVQRLLAKDGYQVLAVSNAREGLALLRDNRVDVVISDQNMPGMLGVDFLQCVQTLSPNTIRILATGYADFQTMADAVNKGGIFRCLPKDIGDDALRNSVREAVQAKIRALENSIPSGTLRK